MGASKRRDPGALAGRGGSPFLGGRRHRPAPIAPHPRSMIWRPRA